MFWILYNCCICFNFTFTAFTNVLNAVDFRVRKRIEKNILEAPTPKPPTPTRKPANVLA